jgi:hypothetical protein
MKTITFKTLSILLAAVILVAALPLAAFAEDSSSSVLPNEAHTHILGLFYPEDCDYYSNEYHIVTLYEEQKCIECGWLIYKIALAYRYENHTCDTSIVDPEVDMQGDCIYCGETFYW